MVNQSSAVVFVTMFFCFFHVFNASSQIQKQIQITIWWWDEQACLLYISVSQTDLPSIRGAFVILDEGSSPLTRVCLINLSFVKSKYGSWKSWWCYSDTGGVSEVVNIVVTRGWWHDDSANKSGNNIPTKSHLTHLVVIIARWCFFFFTVVVVEEVRWKIHQNRYK